MIQSNGIRLGNPRNGRISHLNAVCLGTAIFLVYVIMASAFESILHPFVILFSVPLAIVGVIVGLWMLNMPISVISLIGTIVLSGVVVNNAIVLVDTINRKRTDGLDKDTAIFEAANRSAPDSHHNVDNSIGPRFCTRLR